jgi:hypothetical protein
MPDAVQGEDTALPQCVFAAKVQVGMQGTARLSEAKLRYEVSAARRMSRCVFISEKDQQPAGVCRKRNGPTDYFTTSISPISITSVGCSA